MKKRKLKFFLIFILILLTSTFFVFNKIFIEGKVPLSSNLLVSFYNPWALEKIPGWEGGIPNKPVGIDDLRIFYPQRALTSEMLKEGKIPYWNPYNFSGNAHLALSETAVFYPLSVIFIFVSQIDAWIFMTVVQPLIAGLGMYLFLSRIIADKRGVIFGGIIFAFSGVVIVRAQEGLSVGHTLIWMPYVFYGIESFLNKGRIRYLFISLTTLVFSFLSGWFQFFFYIYSLSFLYLFIRGGFYFRNNFKTKKILAFSVFAFLPFLVLYQLIPALQMLNLSPRSLGNYDNLVLHLMPLQHLITFILPDFFGNPGSYNFFGRSEYKESVLYIGLIPFVFSLFAFKIWKKNILIRFFGILVIASIILGTDNFLANIILRIPFPIISSFLPNRIFLISTFSLTVLAAFGLEYFLAAYKKFSFNQMRFPLLLIITTLSSAVLYVGASLMVNHLVSAQVAGLIKLPFPIDMIQVLIWNLGLVSEEWQSMVQFKNLIIPILIMCMFLASLNFRKKMSKNALFFIIISLTVLPQVYFAQKYLTFSEREFIFPKNRLISYLQDNISLDRFISIGDGYIQSNFLQYFNLYTPDGVSSMYLNRYGELIAYVKNEGRNIVNVQRIETRIEPKVEEIFLGSNTHVLRFMQIDGIRYVITSKDEDFFDKKYDPDNTDSSFKLLWEDATWAVFEFRDVLPRIFWTNNFIIEKEDKKILQNIFSQTHDPRTIILEKDPLINYDKNGSGRIELLEYTPNSITLISSSEVDGLVYISDNYFPDFKAKVNDEDVEILRANYTFRAIPVSKGNNKIHIYYDGRLVGYTFLFGFICLIVMILFSVLLIRKKVFSF